MEVEKLKKKIEMKEVFEDEIQEELETMGEKAIEILIKDDEIFNNTSLRKTTSIFKNGIFIDINSDVEYKLLKEIDKTLNPSKIILQGRGSPSTWMTKESHSIRLILEF